MAKTLSKSGISTGQDVLAGHVTQSVDALTGTEAYDITISGSLVTTGSVGISGSLQIQGIPDVSASIADAAGSSGPTVPTLPVEDNLVLQGTSNATTSQAIYGINVIDLATPSDLATKLPDPITGKQTSFVNNSTMPILVFPSVVGGSINGAVNGFASIPNNGKVYTFYCYENPLPGAWTWSPPATTQYDSGEITFDSVVSGIGAYNVSISNNYNKDWNGSGSPSTFYVFNCQNAELIPSNTTIPPYSAGNTGGVSGVPLSATVMNPTKLKIYTNAKTFQPMYAGLALSYGFSVYDSDQPGGNFITNGVSSTTNGVNTSGGTWLTVPGATLPNNSVSPNIGDPGTQYIILDISNLPSVLSHFINFGPAQYIGPSTNAGEFLWYMGVWQFFIKPGPALTGFKYRFIMEYS